MHIELRDIHKYFGPVKANNGINLTVDAIATEPPYDIKAEKMVKNSLIEMARVLKIDARLAIFCAAWQAGGLRKLSQSLSLVPYLDSPVNRKGTDCVVLAWRKREKVFV